MPNPTSNPSHLTRLRTGIGVLGLLCLWVGLLWGLSGCLYGTECRESVDCGNPGLCRSGYCIRFKGDVKLYASIRHTAEISRVRVIAQSPSHSKDHSANLEQQGKTWHGLLENLPANGEKYSFHLSAYGLGGKLVVEKEIPDFQPQPSKTGAVGFFLQSEDINAPHNSKQPGILGFWSSELDVSPKGNSEWRVIPNPGQDDVLYMWTSNRGTFSPANQKKTIWLAPDATGPQKLTLTLRGPRNQESAYTFPMEVFSKQQQGVTSIQKGFKFSPLDVNAWPTIVSLTASAMQTKPKGSLVLTVVAIDREGNWLNYEWEDDDCQGRFQPLRGASETQWTAPNQSPPSGRCRLKVLVFDGDGGFVKKRITITMEH